MPTLEQSSTAGSSSGTLPAETLEVLIIGAGFSGLGMAIKLLESGNQSFLVLEKADDIGGTWYANRYPGCACDIPSHLYSFSFDRNPDWSRMYSGRDEIQRYLKSCVGKFRLAPYIRLKTRMNSAAWDDRASLWIVQTSQGTVRTRVLISAIGGLHVPKYPDIPGLENFQGTTFHSTAWDSSVSLEGKRVAVIGTGASAIQFVPEIAPKVGKLYLFQRTPPWILPKVDFPIAERWQKRFRRFPALTWFFRTALFWLYEIRVWGFLGKVRVMRKRGQQMALDHLKAQVPDAALRAKLTPSYELGCKRVLISNDFYPAIQRPNVEFITAGIREVREHSIVTQDGVEHPVDVLIYGTGFRVTEPLHDTQIAGRNGLEIHQAWKERISAYLGLTVSGFPNFFILLGPNTGLGHNSVVLMSEAQIGYVMKSLELMRRRKAAAMEVKAETQNSFVQELRERLTGTVWQSGGCRSWYQDAATGENPIIWPGSVVAYIRRTRKVKEKDYVLSSPSSAHS
ncbi:MAG TPA: NAD(P)/FAD-dependent oxidoreductase [Candidatus Angelobacter sp.]|nr:NAD(P)/FAD-dependent oxidoreductase [Candidatus Angelobacter sp.]